MRELATRSVENRTYFPSSVDSLADPSFVLLSHPEPQPTTKGEPGTISSFYLGKYTGPNPANPPREIEGYFIDVHSKGIEVTPVNGQKLSSEQRERIRDEFTIQLRTTPEGHAIMKGLTNKQLMALNIETIVQATYRH